MIVAVVVVVVSRPRNSLASFVGLEGVETCNIAVVVDVVVVEMVELSVREGVAQRRSGTELSGWYFRRFAVDDVVVVVVVR